MPSFVAHVVYAQKFFQQNNIIDPDSLYVIGNLIPDIRYLGVIDRSVTHIPLENETTAWDLVNDLVNTNGEISGKDADLFKRGFLFHNFLDQWWTSKFLIAANDRYLGSALKLYEDQLLYSKIENLPQLLEQLKTQADIFGLKGISKIDYGKWAQINISYLSSPPTTASQMEHFRQWKFISDDQTMFLEKAFTQIPAGTDKKMERVFESFDEVNFPVILLP